MKILFLLILILMIQSGLMTAQLSWHLQNCDLIGSLGSMQEQHIFLQDLDYELINIDDVGPMCLFHKIVSYWNMNLWKIVYIITSILWVPSVYNFAHHMPAFVISSGDGLAMKWWWAITWTNVDQFPLSYMVSAGTTEFNSLWPSSAIWWKLYF